MISAFKFFCLSFLFFLLGKASLLLGCCQIKKKKRERIHTTNTISPLPSPQKHIVSSRKRATNIDLSIDIRHTHWETIIMSRSGIDPTGLPPWRANLYNYAHKFTVFGMIGFTCWLLLNAWGIRRKQSREREMIIVSSRERLSSHLLHPIDWFKCLLFKSMSNRVLSLFLLLFLLVSIFFWQATNKAAVRPKLEQLQAELDAIDPNTTEDFVTLPPSSDQQ